MTDCVNISSLDNGDDEGALGVTLKSVINQVFLPAVCVFGVIGNILNLAILTRQKLQKSFRTLEHAANLCLVALALSDLMFCMCAFLTVFLPVDNIYNNSDFWLIYGKFNVAIINIFIMESTLLTVAMSLERYLAICFPLRQDIYLTTSRIKFVIIFTFIFSVIFNIPVFWRHQKIRICPGELSRPICNPSLTLKDTTSLVHDYNPETHSETALGINAILSTPTSLQILENTPNSSDAFPEIKSLHNNASVLSSMTPSLLSSTQQTSNCTSQSTLSSQTSSHLSTSSTKTSSVKTAVIGTESETLYTIKIVLLYSSHIYDTTYRIVWAFVGNFIPLILLFFFNVCLCRQIYSSYRLRKRLGRQNCTGSSSNVLTITLVAIVVLFFILVAPSEVTLQVSHMTSSGDTPLYRNIEAVLNLMQAINFSGNFILYCTISPHFRKTLKYMMCGMWQFRHRSRSIKLKFKTSSI